MRKGTRCVCVCVNVCVCTRVHVQFFILTSVSTWLVPLFLASGAFVSIFGLQHFRLHEELSAETSLIESPTQANCHRLKYTVRDVRTKARVPGLLYVKNKAPLQPPASDRADRTRVRTPESSVPPSCPSIALLSP